MLLLKLISELIDRVKFTLPNHPKNVDIGSMPYFISFCQLGQQEAKVLLKTFQKLAVFDSFVCNINQFLNEMQANYGD